MCQQGSSWCIQQNGAKKTNLMRYIMKKYVKPQLVAKNNPTGSFAAGCPTNKKPNNFCQSCELVR